MAEVPQIDPFDHHMSALEALISARHGAPKEDPSDPMRYINRLFPEASDETRSGYAPGHRPELTSREPDTRDLVGERLGNAWDASTIPARLVMDVAAQPVRAGQALSDAAMDPSLAKLTNAGVQTALAIPAARAPLAAAGIMAGGLGIGAARDAGLSAISSAEAAPKKALAVDLNEEMSNGLTRGQTQSLADQTKQPFDVIAGMRRKDASDLAKQVAIAAATAGIGAQSKDQDAARARFDSASQAAKDTRDKALAKIVPFGETEFGKVYNQAGGVAPFLGGVIGGAVTRAGTGALANAVGHDINSLISRLGLPAASGFGGALTTVNAPLIYEGSQNVLDPKRQAYEDYLLNLPDTLPNGQPNPERVKYEAEIKRLDQTNRDAGIPVGSNPSREAARADFYNPAHIAERAVQAGLEGPLGGIVGSELWNAFSRVPGAAVNKLFQIPGQAREGYQTANAIADRALAEAGAEKKINALALNRALAAEPEPASLPAYNENTPRLAGADPQANPRPAPQGAPQLQMLPATRQNAVPYGQPQRDTVRPYIADEIAGGRGVPSLDDVNAKLSAVNVAGPLNPAFSNRLSSVADLYRAAKQAGLSDDEAARLITERMRIGGRNLPMIALPLAGGAAGANALLSSQSDHRQPMNALLSY